ncbi:MAG: hypothetical protein Roseis2KO_46250 [Roseivirga sp.]
MIKVGIIGPESTGKTALAKRLAEEYKTLWVPEYAREYLTNLGRPYVQTDLLEIAQGQIDSVKATRKKASRILFIDTDIHVIKVWSDYKYGNCDPWIMQQLDMNVCDVYLLTYHDIPYEDDPLRENPDDRHVLYDMYEKLVNNRGLSYMVMKGGLEERVKSAKSYINRLL